MSGIILFIPNLKGDYMKLGKFISILSLGFFLILGASCDNDSRAQSSTIQFSNNFVGTFVNGTTDTNSDGFSAAVLTLQGQSTSLGANSIGSKLELIPVVPEEPCITPNGGNGFEATLVEGVQVISISGDDQIFIELQDLTECLAEDTDTDPSFSFSGVGLITGGVGEFEEASGTTTFSGTGTFMISDDSGFFGSANGELTGTIELN